MKKLITLLCTVLMLLTWANTIFADNVDNEYDPYIELVSASADTVSVRCSGTVDDENVVALVILVVDEDKNVLTMEAVEVTGDTFSYRINVPLEDGETYIVRVANYDNNPYYAEKGLKGAPWHELSVIAKEPGNTSDGENTGKKVKNTSYIVPKTGIE